MSRLTGETIGLEKGISNFPQMTWEVLEDPEYPNKYIFVGAVQGGPQVVGKKPPEDGRKPTSPEGTTLMIGPTRTDPIFSLATMTSRSTEILILQVLVLDTPE